MFISNFGQIGLQQKPVFKTYPYMGTQFDKCKFIISP